MAVECPVHGVVSDEDADQHAEECGPVRPTSAEPIRLKEEYRP